MGFSIGDGGWLGRRSGAKRKIRLAKERKWEEKGNKKGLGF